jgi:hypothetical protein
MHKLTILVRWLLFDYLENHRTYGKSIGYKMFNFFSATLIRNIFRSNKYSASYTPDARRNAYRLSDYNQNWNVTTNFSKTSQYRISGKSVQQYEEMVHADGQTGIATLIGEFLQLFVVNVQKQKYTSTRIMLLITD